eukprot:364326-Chlamydomonas_euryale.AAC.8
MAGASPTHTAALPAHDGAREQLRCERLHLHPRHDRLACGAGRQACGERDPRVLVERPGEVPCIPNAHGALHVLRAAGLSAPTVGAAAAAAARRPLPCKEVTSCMAF